MSHYAVAVFANNPDDFGTLLAPFDEGDHQVAHLMDEEELKKQYDKFLVQNEGWRELGFEYWLEENGYKRENGQIYAYYNPNAKWDWYSLDGRDYLFDLKPDVEPPEDAWCYRKNDYDYHCDDNPEEAKRSARFWEVYVEGQPLGKDEEEPQTIFTREYYLERFGDKKTYVDYSTKTFPYAFITPDGVWHAPGTVGWFATDDATGDSIRHFLKEWDDYIASEENPYVNFVDCHI